MIICPECGHAALGEPVTCPCCGKLFMASWDGEEYASDHESKEIPGVESTLVINREALASRPVPQKEWRSAEVGQGQEIHLQVNGTTHTLTLLAEDVITIGRGDPNGGITPDVDLTPHDAHEHGVSRLHAAIRLEGSMLMVKDMGSMNGTFINDCQLVPHQWRVLRDQDRLRLGTLVLTLHLRVPSQRIAA